MNIAIVGYGKMGKMIRSCALEQGHRISAVIDPVSSESAVSGKALSDIPLDKTDVVIDFSAPESALENILFYGKNGVSAVIGTTGWYTGLDKIKSSLDLSRASIIYSGNFSIGVAILLKTAEYLSRLMNKAESYDVAIFEAHHSAKKDAPSGTAEMIAAKVLENIDRKTRVLYGNPEGKINNTDLQISSMRLGAISGKHSIIFDSDADSITLSHSAKTRQGFASGAVAAASWIYGRKGLFSMDDFINDFLMEE